MVPGQKLVKEILCFFLKNRVTWMHTQEAQTSPGRLTAKTKAEATMNVPMSSPDIRLDPFPWSPGH